MRARRLPCSPPGPARSHERPSRARGAFFPSGRRPSMEETGGVVTAGPLPVARSDPSQLARVFSNRAGNAVTLPAPPHAEGGQGDRDRPRGGRADREAARRPVLGRVHAGRGLDLFLHDPGRVKCSGSRPVPAGDPVAGLMAAPYAAGGVRHGAPSPSRSPDGRFTGNRRAVARFGEGPAVEHGGRPVPLPAPGPARTVPGTGGGCRRTGNRTAIAIDRPGAGRADIQCYSEDFRNSRQVRENIGGITMMRCRVPGKHI